MIGKQDKSEATIDSHEIDVDNIPCAVLKRLIEEVRSEIPNNLGKFNRTHNSHNRGSSV